jgi:hypothetical protein
VRAGLWTTCVVLWNVMVVALPSLAAPAPVAAQVGRRGIIERPDRTRQGFWLSLGLGAGAESFDLRDGAGFSSSLTEPTLSLGLGGTVGDHFRLGAEVLAWFRGVNGGTESLTSFLGIVQYYPLDVAGLYFKGGAGLGRNGTDFNDGFSVADFGFATLLGAGYEIRLGRRFALVPAADYSLHFYTSDRQSAGYRERLLHVGLSVLFQTGR